MDFSFSERHVVFYCSVVLGALNEATLALAKNAMQVIAWKQRAIVNYRMGHLAQARIDIQEALALSRN